jgi:hypothetical protein
MAQEAVSRHRNRETGAVIEVWRAEDMPGSRDTPESMPWITLCVDHGETRYNATQGHAAVAAYHPVLSCRTCFWLHPGEGPSHEPDE